MIAIEIRGKVNEVMIAIVLLVSLVFIGAGALMLYPAFGGRVSAAQRGQYSLLPHHDGKKFKNAIPTHLNISLKDRIQIVRKMIKSDPDRRPSQPIPMVMLKQQDFKQPALPLAIWFGHSSALLQLEGKTMLFDPMFGRAPSPFPFIGGGRYSGKLPMDLEGLPEIDTVFFSHDHYDHLDYGTVKALKHKVSRFVVPLGVGSHLKRWGINPRQIHELDWWDELVVDGMLIAAAPAQHFSGRGLLRRDSTLWCSWVIQGADANIFFSGDSGYGPHFKEIGRRYGPFDLTLMECGQYHEMWASIHMLPEQTVQAHKDVGGKMLIPIHWGGFTLAIHAWNDPAERVRKAAEKHKVQIATPKIGESVFIGAANYPNSQWWRERAL